MIMDNHDALITRVVKVILHLACKHNWVITHVEARQNARIALWLADKNNENITLRRVARRALAMHENEEEWCRRAHRKGEKSIKIMHAETAVEVYKMVRAARAIVWPESTLFDADAAIAPVIIIP